MLSKFKKELHAYLNEQKQNPTLEKNFTLPSSSYRSQERFTEETHVLKQFPLAIGPLESFKSQDGYLLGGTTVENTKLFYNACPHRGAKLESHDKGFRCRYHGWEFDEMGRLSASTGRVCPYKPGALKLSEVKGSHLGGMFFQGSLEGKFIAEIRELSKEGHFLEEKSNKIKANWKFVVESLLETYHFPYAHHGVLGDFKQAYYSLSEQDNDNSRIMVPLDEEVLGLGENNMRGVNVMYFVFPYSFVLFMNTGYVWFLIRPVDLENSVLVRALFSSGSFLEARKSMEVLDKILDDDFAILESQQESASVYERYCLTGHEVPIKEFHQSLNRSLQN